MNLNHLISNLTFSLLVIIIASRCAPTNALKLAPTSRKPASHSWANYHWAVTTNPANLKVGNCLTTTDWSNLLTKTTNDWNNPAAFGATTTPIISQIVGCKITKRCAMVAGTTQVCNGTYGNNGWLGLASINISGDHITQGSAKMNDTYFKTAKYNNPNEKLHVICQELAHTFGLGHQSEDGSSQNSCMDYFSNTGANATSTTSTTPNVHDFDQLNLLYGHLDGTSTLANSATLPEAVLLPSDLEDPRDWGQLMSQSENGRGSIYERDNKNGSKTVTHVYWTEEVARKCPQCDHRDDN